MHDISSYEFLIGRERARENNRVATRVGHEATGASREASTGRQTAV